MQYISITCVMLIERSVRGRMCDSGSFLTILHLYIVLINNNRWRMYDDADGVKKFETLFKRNSICIIQIYQVICLVCLPISEKLNTLQFPRHVRVNIGRSCISTRSWYWYSGLLVTVNYGIFFFCRPVQHVLIKYHKGYLWGLTPIVFGQRKKHEICKTLTGYVFTLDKGDQV
jgi:hypothetical protein